MSMMTHESRWRLLVGAAPVIGVAFFVWAAAQGDVDLARSPTARAILAAVAALGTAVAWWTAHQLRAKPTVSVSKAGALAQAGQLAASVTLRGRARALPDAVPLVSPDGELCLWFASGDAVPSRDSVRPFLLVDDSGECIVLPAGAEVTGHGSVPASAARSGLADGAAARGPRPAERLLRNGDRVQVVGHFVAASPESLALQAQLRSGDPLPFRDLRSAAQAGAAFVAAPPFARHGLLLPVIAAPASGQPLGIRIGADDGEGGVYGLLAVVDSVVLVVSSSLVAWAMLVPG